MKNWASGVEWSSGVEWRGWRSEVINEVLFPSMHSLCSVLCLEFLILKSCRILGTLNELVNKRLRQVRARRRRHSRSSAGRRRSRGESEGESRIRRAPEADAGAGKSERACVRACLCC